MSEDTAPSAGHEAHEALRTLYHVALSADPHNVPQVTQAYLRLVDYMGSVEDCQPGVEPERLSALGRLLLESGDITAMGARMLEKVARDRS